MKKIKRLKLKKNIKNKKTKNISMQKKNILGKKMSLKIFLSKKIYQNIQKLISNFFTIENKINEKKTVIKGYLKIQKNCLKKIWIKIFFIIPLKNGNKKTRKKITCEKAKLKKKTIKNVCQKNNFDGKKKFIE